jgi:Fe-S cluster assembly ATPase SufC
MLQINDLRAPVDGKTIDGLTPDVGAGEAHAITGPYGAGLLS